MKLIESLNCHSTNSFRLLGHSFDLNCYRKGELIHPSLVVLTNSSNQTKISYPFIPSF